MVIIVFFFSSKMPKVETPETPVLLTVTFLIPVKIYIFFGREHSIWKNYLVLYVLHLSFTIL